MVAIEESKRSFAEGEDAPSVEELTEDEYTQEMKHQEPELSPEQEEEIIQTLRMQNTLKKIEMELNGHEQAAKEGYVNEKYNFAYQEYKAGLKGLSDCVKGHEAREHPALKAKYQFRRRKFCINAAAACIKVRHWSQGLEACTLVLDEGPDDDMQRRKALFRAGVCARGMGELDEARGFLAKLLEDDGIDEKTRRDVAKQLRIVADEKKSYKKFAREMCSDKNQDSIIFPGEKVKPTGKELERLAEVEEKRERYLVNKKTQEENEEKKRRNGGGGSSSTSLGTIRPPEVMISEADCISILDTLAERYAAVEVQEQLKQASLDHNLKFNKGYIIRSKQILGPIQRDIFDKYCFWGDNHVSGKVESSEDKKAALARAVDVSEFMDSLEETLGDLLLVGAGVCEKEAEKVSRFENRNLYSLAVYTDDHAKARIISDMPSSNDNESASTLRAALKSSDQITFLLKLNAEIGLQGMSIELSNLVYLSKPPNSSLVQCSSLVFAAGSGMENGVFPPGTTFQIDCDCVVGEAKFTVDGKEVGEIPGLADAFCNGFLDHKTVGPSLHQSVMKHCCNESRATGGDASKENTAQTVTPAEKAANTKAHDQALRKLQHSIRYLANDNKEIAEKMDLCQRLAIGEVIMDQTDD